MTVLPASSQLDRLCVVLVATRNPLNIGAVARAMSNFGIRHLRVVNPYQPSFREARSAVGGSPVLAAAEQFDSVEAAVADCTLVVGTKAARRTDLQHNVFRPEAAARRIRKRLASSRVAILFGSEKSGLSNDDLSHCHWLMRIETAEENISMNLGQAAAICLYEIVRDPKASKPENSAPARSVEVERITTGLLEVLQACGYLGRRRVGHVELRIRRLVRRLRLPARDTTIWLGILRQILWKMNSVERNREPKSGLPDR